ncbi:chemotaxis protein CheD [Oceanidesulfovibrio marinus]|uniref:Chemotaxis protein CheD n=1 Tax=Oceanidesulfovibrio marinus TaxID=370038 RepID=A0A6P1ZL22_9BACT|nr:chemotaxis protein CheD [Oceanidesulfovibrio marinus]
MAITVFDKRTKIGGMAHAFLPYAKDYVSDPGYPCKFVDASVDYLMRVFSRLRVEHSRLEVKVFGGGDALSQCQVHRGTAGCSRSWAGVGPRNVEAAREVLAKRGLRIAAEDVGGVLGRKVLFLTHTGGVWVKKLDNGYAKNNCR